MQSSYRELQIDFVPSDRSYKCEYENPSFTLEQEAESENDEEDSDSDENDYEDELPSSSFVLPRLSTSSRRRF